MSLATKVISGIVIAGGISFVATPLIYQKQIDKFIQKQTTQYDLKEIKKNDSFFKVNREYIFTIKNSKELIKQEYPKIDKQTLDDAVTLIENTKLLLKVNILKYPIYHKKAITIDLLSLNKPLTNQLKQTPEGKKVLEFIKNKGIEAYLDINNLKINKATLKDIDFSPNKLSNITIKNAYIAQTNNTKTTNISKFIYKNDKDSISIDSLSEHKKLQNSFNFVDKIKIKHISLNKDNMELNISNLSQTLKASTIVNDLNIKTNSNIKNVHISSDNQFIDINNLKLNYKISKLDLKHIKMLINYPNNQKIQKVSVSYILSHGFELNVNPISIDNATIKLNKPINIDKISINLTAKEKPHQIAFDDINAAVKNFDAKLNISTTKHNINLISQINPFIPMYLKSIMVEKNNNVFINLEYKNEHLISKGKILF